MNLSELLSYIYSRPKHPSFPLVPLGDYFTAQCTCVREDSLQFSLTLFLMTGGVSTLHWKKICKCIELPAVPRV